MNINGKEIIVHYSERTRGGLKADECVWLIEQFNGVKNTPGERAEITQILKEALDVFVQTQLGGRRNKATIDLSNAYWG